MTEQGRISTMRRLNWSPPAPSGEPKLPKSPLQWLANVKSERVDWLWKPYIPFRKLTILGGDPGQGKSFITAAIAAALSRGEGLPGMPEEPRDPMVTLLLAGEDDPGDTLRPRLEGFHADLTKIAVYDGPLLLDAEGLRKLEAMIVETGARFVVIDPIVAYLGAKTDMYRSNEVRPIMKGIADLAVKYDAATLMVRHMRKQPAGSKGGKAIYNGMGSIDFTAAVRSELQVDEDKHGNRYLNHVKTNIGPKGKSVRYMIEEDTFRWGGVVEDMPSLVGLRPTVSRKLMHDAAVRQFIFDEIKNSPNGVPAGDIMLKAKARGFTESKLKLVKKGMVLSVKQGDQWLWMLDPTWTAPVEDDAVIEIQ